MYNRTPARTLQPGDVFKNRGNWCVVDFVSVGVKVSISARQCFTQIKANQICEYDATVRTPLIDNHLETIERCTCTALDDQCDACPSLTSF